MTSSLINAKDSVVLIIDIQEKLLKAIPESEKLIKNASILAKTAKILEIPVLVTEQYPKGLGFTHPELRINIDEKADFVEKTTFSCTEEQDFLRVLKSLNKKQVIVCGMETHICVHQTVNGLLKQGFDVYLVKDAISSRKKEEYEIGIERMLKDGAVLSSVEMVLFELLQGAKHPSFKEIQALIK